MEYCDKEKVNPFLRDYYIKQFNDVFKYGESKYNNDYDNFTYVRKEQDDNSTSAIVEDILYFLMRYQTFYERTGLGFHELMSMDPSMLSLVQNTWETLVRPEEKEAAKLSKLQGQMDELTKFLRNGGR